MQARGIPRNPNSPPPVTPAGVHAHWSRTLVLVLLLVLIGYALRAQSAQHNRFSPASALNQPVIGLQPALSQVQPPPAPPSITAQPAPTIGGEALPVPSGAQLRELLVQANSAFSRARSTADSTPLRAVATSSWLEWEHITVQADGSASPAALSCFIEHYTLVRQGSAWLVSQIELAGTDCAG